MTTLTRARPADTSTPDRDPSAGWLRLLWGFVGPARRLLLVSIGAALVTHGDHHRDPAGLEGRRRRRPRPEPSQASTGWLIVLFALGILRFFATRARRWRAGRVSYDVQCRLRTRLYEHLLHLDPTALDQLRTGQLVSRASADLTLVQQFLAWGPQVVANVLQLVASIVAMLFLSWPLGLVAMVVVPLTIDLGGTLPRRRVRRQLGRPATRGRAHQQRRGSGHRRTGGQGLRPGGRRDRAGHGRGAAACTPGGCAPPGSGRRSPRRCRASRRSASSASC